MDRGKIPQPTDQDQRQYLQFSSVKRSSGLKTLLITKNNLFKNKTNTGSNIYLKT